MPFGQFNAVVISVSPNCPLTKVITYQLTCTPAAAAEKAAPAQPRSRLHISPAHANNSFATSSVA